MLVNKRCAWMVGLIAALPLVACKSDRGMERDEDGMGEAIEERDNEDMTVGQRVDQGIERVDQGVERVGEGVENAEDRVDARVGIDPGTPEEMEAFKEFVQNQQGTTGTQAQTGMQGSTDTHATGIHGTTGAQASSDRDHSQLAQGIELLHDAIAALARDEDVYTEVSQDLSVMKSMADSLKQDPQSMQHAGMVEKAFTSAYNAMKVIQTTDDNMKDLEPQMEQLRQSATAFQETQPLLDQYNQVLAFFQQASDALYAINDEVEIEGDGPDFRVEGEDDTQRVQPQSPDQNQTTTPDQNERQIEDQTAPGQTQDTETDSTLSVP